MNSVWISGLVFLAGTGLVALTAASKRKKHGAHASSALATKIEEELAQIDKAESVSERVDACERALGYLREAGANYSVRPRLVDFDELLERLEALKRVLTLVEPIERARQQRVDKNTGAERDALLDVVYQMESFGITDSDIASASVQLRQGEYFPSVKEIQERLGQLGWDAVKGRPVEDVSPYPQAAHHPDPEPDESFYEDASDLLELAQSPLPEDLKVKARERLRRRGVDEETIRIVYPEPPQESE